MINFQKYISIYIFISLKQRQTQHTDKQTKNTRSHAQV